MGGGGGGFLQYMDSMAMAFGFLLFLWVLHHACGRYIRLHHGAFLGGSMVATVVVFLVGRKAELALDPFVGTMTLLAAVLLAGGFLAMADVRRRITPYFMAFCMVGVLGYALAAHYGNVTAQIWQMPLFWATVIPSAAALLALPVWLMTSRGDGIHALWVPLGTILLCVAGYYMVGTTNQTIAIPAENAAPLINTLLAAGFFCLLLGFLLVRRWLDAEKAEE
ncbi:hypothetical protein J2Z79_002538 [Symbiobacterium terraclitae]|uniref:DUF4203 domain-containing protein n=1 Tax=Symbiobacterium terraclitae TaxID=557451 RepID=A0ABS4JUA0_9FIRM|nr:hypothetical protein [Symbiobacterium terraclitae]MBP2019121.1 hypothetical protein [Symbiobacterium terraclitae]